MRDTIGTDACEIWVQQGEMATPELRDRQARASEARRRPWMPQRDRRIRARSSCSLQVHARSVGMLALRHHSPIELDAGARRFLSALAYYAALGIERVRLVAEAERAEALREADRLKDALLASVSHDLRTPLTTIKALAHDIAGDGDERAATIEQQADRLNRMVADLLDLSRLNAGELPVRAELNAAEDVVGAAIQQVSAAFAGRELRTSIAWSEPVLVGRFDFVHALRILVNLLENAHKYSPRAMPVDVLLARAGSMIAISVADRGPGIPIAERERIFEPFYRPERSTPDAGSAGLGLSIALRLAMAQGGTLYVRGSERRRERVHARAPGGGRRDDGRAGRLRHSSTCFGAKFPSRCFELVRRALHAPHCPRCSQIRRGTRARGFMLLPLSRAATRPDPHACSSMRESSHSARPWATARGSASF